MSDAAPHPGIQIRNEGPIRPAIGYGALLNGDHADPSYALGGREGVAPATSNSFTVDQMEQVDAEVTNEKYKQLRRKAFYYVFAILGLTAGCAVGAFFLKDDTAAVWDFTACWLLEIVLSTDNCFVVYLIFKRYKIPVNLQIKCLVYGLLVSLPMRAACIGGLDKAAQALKYVLLPISAWLLYQAYQIFFGGDEEEEDLDNSWILNKLEATGAFSRKLHSDKFFATVEGRTKGTLLLLAIIAVESLDVLFAVDSVGAIVTISDYFPIMYASNVLAVLLLRSLYVLIVAYISDYPEAQYVAAVMLVWVAVNIHLDFWEQLPDTTSEIQILVTSCLLAAGAAAICLYRFCIKRSDDAEEERKHILSHNGEELDFDD